MGPGGRGLGEEDDLEFVDEALDAPVLDVGAPLALPDDNAAVRAVELATDPVSARALAAAASRPPVREMVDRLLAGDFPPWVRPVSRASRAPPGKREAARETDRAAVMAEASRLNYATLRSRLADIEARLLEDGEGEKGEKGWGARAVYASGVDVLLADGTLFRCAPGDRVAVDAVEFLASAPKPAPRRKGAKLTRAALLAALPGRSDVVEAVRAVAAADGPDAASALLEAHGLVATLEERGRISEGLAAWKPRSRSRSRDAGVRTRGGIAAPPVAALRATEWGLRRDAPEVMGEPEGRLEMSVADAVEQPAVALRAYKKWLATARRAEPMLGATGGVAVAKETAPVAPGVATALVTPFEIVRAHASEYEGGRTGEGELAFDDAPDFLTQPPDRADVEAAKDDAMERDYRERARDPDGRRWATHLSILRDGVAALPPFDVDLVAVAALAERVLAAKAARYVKARPDTSRADVDAIKAKQVAVHTLAALAAFAEFAGVPDAVRRLEALAGSAGAVGKAFVDTLDQVPELRHGRVPKASEPKASEPKASEPKAAFNAAAAAARGTKATPMVPLVRWWVAKPPSSAAKRVAPATPAGLPNAVVLPAADAADDARSMRHAVALDHAHPFALTASILRAHKAGDVADLLAEQDGAYLDHVARHRLPLMMPDPSLRDLLIADAASRPPLASVPRFDAAAARRAGAFAIARAMALPRIAMQLGGADMSLAAVATAFARAHSLPAPKGEDVTFPSTKMRTSEYDRFEETELVPWLVRALRANAPKTTALKASIGDIRRKENERKDAALDALDPERYKAVMELRRVGAFDEAAFERLVQEQAAEAEAGAGAEAEAGADDDGYAMTGDEGGEDDTT